MNKFISKNIVERFLIIVFPILLISGPALPDIFAVSVILYFLIYKYKLYKEKILYDFWSKIFTILWLWFLLISFFAYNILLSISDAIVFVRFCLFTVATPYKEGFLTGCRNTFAPFERFVHCISFLVRL